MKILITAGKSASALKKLNRFDQYQVVLADYGEVPLLFSKHYQIISLGEKNEETLAHTLLNHCLNEEITAILPLQADEVEAVLKAETLFNEFGIEVLLP